MDDQSESEMTGLERQETRQLLSIWTQIRGQKRFPTYTDINFDDLKDYEPNLFLLDLISDNEFIVSRMGETLIERIGSDFTGFNLLELMDSSRAAAVGKRAEAFFELGCAGCTHHQVPTTVEDEQKRVEILFLPVDNGSGRPRQILGAIYYSEGPDKTASHQGTADGFILLDETFLQIGNSCAGDHDDAAAGTSAG